MRKFVPFSAVVVAALLTGPVFAQQALLKNSKTGDPQVKSIQAITFAPNGVLLIGDGAGKQVVAIDTGDTKPQKWTKANLPPLTKQLAMRLGTDAKNIKINKLAVNPASHKAYIAVRHQGAKGDLIITVDGDGKIAEFPLDSVRHARIALPDQGKVALITDISWAGDRVLVAAQANDAFRSKLFTITAPFAGDGDACSVFSTETYHVAHRNWETRAPMYTIIPYEQERKRYVIGAFTCTPIVKFSLDAMESGAKVKGESIIEIGSGNKPQDMFTYTKNGKKYILMTMYRVHHKRRPVGPSPYWTVRVDYDLLKETKNVNKEALWRVNSKYESITDRAIVVPAYHYVTHMDQLDADRALVIRTDENGGSTLSAVPLP